MTASSSKASSRFESTPDLCNLPAIAEDTVLAIVRDRYLASRPYTSISPCVLVSVNPYGYVPVNGDASLQDYVAEYLRSSVDDDVSRGRGNSRGTDGIDVESRDPHVFRLALDGYYNMRRTGQDQVIMLSGAVGSGKTETRRLAIKAISEVAVPGPGKKGSKIGTQIANAQFILESFGNAHTLANENASRYGNYTELQFNDQGRLGGLKTIDYYLERSRVSQTPLIGERNFHVLYYLVAGVSGEERTHLKLADVNEYRYLQCRVRRQGPADAAQFEKLKQAFKVVGLSSRLVAQVCQLLAAIIHIGNLQFVSGGPSHEGAVVTSLETLDIVAEFLGILPQSLAELFAFKTLLVKREVCTTFLEPDKAEGVRDELARTLYSLLFTWLNEHINQKLCKDSFSSFMAILDLPGLQNNAAPTTVGNSVDQFCFNLASEQLHQWILCRVFQAPAEDASKEKIDIPRVPHFDNSECIKMLCDPRSGIVRIMDDQSAKKKSETSFLEALGKRYPAHSSISIGNVDRHNSPTFTINHYSGAVTYSTENFLERNANETSSDILRLLRGSSIGPTSSQETTGSGNPFIRSLFSNKSIAMQAHPRNDETIVAVQQPVRPMRAPSTRRKGRGRLSSVKEEDQDKGEGEDQVGGGNEGGAAGQELHCMVGQHSAALASLLLPLEQAQPWYIFCLRPNDSQLPSQVEIRSVRSQIRSLGLAEMAQSLKIRYEVQMSHREACERYEIELEVRGIPKGPAWVDRLQDLKRVLQLGDAEIAIGANRVFLSHSVFHRFEDRLRRDERDPSRDREELEVLQDRQLRVDPFSPSYDATPLQSPRLGAEGFDRDGSSVALPLVEHAHPIRQDSPDGYSSRQDLGVPVSDTGDTASNVGSASYAPSKNMFQEFDTKNEKDPLDEGPQDGEVQEQYKESMARRRWVWLCAVLTWWIPSFLLSWIGGMKRQDIRQAWREKLAINMIIWFICGCTIFVIAVLGVLICPTQHVYSSAELASHNFKDDPNNAFVAIRGEVFDLSSFAPTHLTTVSVVPTKSIMQYGGLDASNLFPVQVSALCPGTTGTLSQFVTLDTTNVSDPNAAYHDFRAYTNDSRPDWYEESMIMLRYRFRTGFVGYSHKDISNMASAGRAVAIYENMVYELTTYIQQNGGGLKGPNGYQFTSQDQSDRQFLSPQVVDLFTYNSGKDITDLLNKLGGTIGNDVQGWQTQCLRNLFLIGKVDTRDSPQCHFSTYILLALSCIMVSIIGFKFLAALHFGSTRSPENQDKFVIVQVPCYTEGEESLRKTIDSVVRTRYDDQRKLLMIICDGNIKGYGNDKPTPAIVLDILGVDPHNDPEPLSFQSLGEGAKQHNMAEVYCGLYECAGHVVPYMVIVKVGKPSERPKPGNRGKRDSQMLLMSFLNKVHFSAPMNPLELDMYHQIKNVVGINPEFFEYLMVVDADTTVHELSINHFISAFMHDKKIIGVCGETSIANAKHSIVTMAQVYEYFISHHLSKAFESLFGSITCLPGCFSMYRLRTPDSFKPLFIANSIIHDYSENRVDTLHLKNLLHLGEDRYLTTLVLKHFPTYKTKFVRDAHAQTVAPDSAKVLLSQRRRWINSTVHNLAELVFLDQLCGFCCFSMRFVVFIDLLSTIVAPVTVAYIGYLIYLVTARHGTIPILSIIMLGAIYGLQALIFVFRLRWDMIAWMVFYILAIPVFSFFLPLYSFWKMDDFSWGSTRLVVGEKGKRMVIHDEGKFDPRSIPLKSWQEHENELWDQESNPSLQDHKAPYKAEYDGGGSRASTTYGGGYDHSRVPSTYDLPALPYGGAVGESPVGPSMPPPDTRSMYGGQAESVYRAGSVFGDARSVHVNSLYGMADPNLRASSYSFAGMNPFQPPMDPRMSSYSFSRPDMQARHSSYSFQGQPYGQVEPTPSFLPAPTTDSSPINLGPDGVTDAQLEVSIRKLCQGADWDTLTKKGVRKKLEEEYGCSLTTRKEVIDKILMTVVSEQGQ